MMFQQTYAAKENRFNIQKALFDVNEQLQEINKRNDQNVYNELEKLYNQQESDIEKLNRKNFEIQKELQQQKSLYQSYQEKQDKSKRFQENKNAYLEKDYLSLNLLGNYAQSIGKQETYDFASLIPQQNKPVEKPQVDLAYLKKMQELKKTFNNQVKQNQMQEQEINNQFQSQPYFIPQPQFNTKNFSLPQIPQNRSHFIQSPTIPHQKQRRTKKINQTQMDDYNFNSEFNMKEHKQQQLSNIEYQLERKNNLIANLINQMEFNQQELEKKQNKAQKRRKEYNFFQEQKKQHKNNQHYIGRPLYPQINWSSKHQTPNFMMANAQPLYYQNINPLMLNGIKNPLLMMYCVQQPKQEKKFEEPKVVKKKKKKKKKLPSEEEILLQEQQIAQEKEEKQQQYEQQQKIEEEKKIEEQKQEDVERQKYLKSRLLVVALMLLHIKQSCDASQTVFQIRYQYAVNSWNTNKKKIEENILNWIFTSCNKFISVIIDSKINFIIANIKDFPNLFKNKISEKVEKERVQKLFHVCKEILDALTNNCKKDLFNLEALEFLNFITHNNGIIPQSFLYQSEVNRLEFSQQGTLKNMTEEKSGMLIGSFIIQKLLIIQLLLNLSKFYKQLKVTDLLQGKVLIVCSILYHLIQDYLNRINTIPNNQDSIKPQYKIESLIPYVHKLKEQSVIENEENQSIQGMLSKEELEVFCAKQQDLYQQLFSSLELFLQAFWNMIDPLYASQIHDFFKRLDQMN